MKSLASCFLLLFAYAFSIFHIRKTSIIIMHLHVIFVNLFSYQAFSKKSVMRKVRVGYYENKPKIFTDES